MEITILYEFLHAICHNTRSNSWNADTKFICVENIKHFLKQIVLHHSPMTGRNNRLCKGYIENK